MRIYGLDSSNPRPLVPVDEAVVFVAAAAHARKINESLANGFASRESTFPEALPPIIRVAAVDPRLPPHPDQALIDETSAYLSSGGEGPPARTSRSTSAATASGGGGSSLPARSSQLLSVVRPLLQRKDATIAVVRAEYSALETMKTKQRAMLTAHRTTLTKKIAHATTMHRKLASSRAPLIKAKKASDARDALVLNLTATNLAIQENDARIVTRERRLREFADIAASLKSRLVEQRYVYENDEAVAMELFAGMKNERWEARAAAALRSDYAAASIYEAEANAIEAIKKKIAADDAVVLDPGVRSETLITLAVALKSVPDESRRASEALESAMNARYWRISLPTAILERSGDVLFRERADAAAARRGTARADAAQQLQSDVDGHTSTVVLGLQRQRSATWRRCIAMHESNQACCTSTQECCGACVDGSIMSSRECCDKTKTCCARPCEVFPKVITSAWDIKGRILTGQWVQDMIKDDEVETNLCAYEPKSCCLAAFVIVRAIIAVAACALGAVGFGLSMRWYPGDALHGNNLNTFDTVTNGWTFTFGTDLSCCCTIGLGGSGQDCISGQDVTKKLGTWDCPAEGNYVLGLSELSDGWTSHGDTIQFFTLPAFDLPAYGTLDRDSKPIWLKSRSATHIDWTSVDAMAFCNAESVWLFWGALTLPAAVVFCLLLLSMIRFRMNSTSTNKDDSGHSEPPPCPLCAGCLVVTTPLFVLFSIAWIWYGWWAFALLRWSSSPTTEWFGPAVNARDPSNSAPLPCVGQDDFIQTVLWSLLIFGAMVVSFAFGSLPVVIHLWKDCNPGSNSEDENKCSTDCSSFHCFSFIMLSALLWFAMSFITCLAISWGGGSSLFWWSLLLPTLLTCPLLFCMCLHPTHCRACARSCFLSFKRRWNARCSREIH